MICALGGPATDGRQQLQITDSRNNLPRQFGQQKYQHYNNRPQHSNNNNRNGYGQQQPRTYHAGNDDQAQYYDETQQYQAYEDGYYSTADFTGNDYITVDADEDGPTDKDDTHDDTVESHFTSPFTSRTLLQDDPIKEDLHQHIRTGIHYRPAIKSRDLATSPDLAAEAVVNNSKPDDSADIKLIRSISTDQPSNGYAFKGYRYVTAKARLTELGPDHDICWDTGCTMSLIDRQFLTAHLPEAVIQKMPTSMNVRGIGEKRHDASEFVSVQLFVPTQVPNEVAVIKRELHLVD
ncbi:MAG: hypothetical protein Q9228_007988, partial [Teloschistes exilis]